MTERDPLIEVLDALVKKIAAQHKCQNPNCKACKLPESVINANDVLLTLQKQRSLIAYTNINVARLYADADSKLKEYDDFIDKELQMKFYGVSAQVVLPAMPDPVKHSLQTMYQARGFKVIAEKSKEPQGPSDLIDVTRFTFWRETSK